MQEAVAVPCRVRARLFGVNDLDSCVLSATPPTTNPQCPLGRETGTQDSGQLDGATAPSCPQIRQRNPAWSVS